MHSSQTTSSKLALLKQKELQNYFSNNYLPKIRTTKIIFIFIIISFLANTLPKSSSIKLFQTIIISIACCTFLCTLTFYAFFANI